MNYSTRNQRIRNLSIFGLGALAIVFFPALLAALFVAPKATGVMLAMPSLFAILGADINPFKRKMDEAKGVARSGGQNIARELATSIGSGFTGMALLTGASRFVERVAREANDIELSSEKLGLSVERFQALKYEAERTGASIATVSSAFRNLAKSSIDAESGQGDAIDAFKALSIQVDALKSKSPDQIFSEIAKSVHGAQLSTQQLVALNKLLGKSYQDLLPGLQRGAFANARDPFGDTAEEVGKNKRFFDDLRVLKGAAGEGLEKVLNPAENEGGGLFIGLSALRQTWCAKNTTSPHSMRAPLSILSSRSKSKTCQLKTEREQRLASPR